MAVLFTPGGMTGLGRLWSLCPVAPAVQSRTPPGLLFPWPLTTVGVACGPTLWSPDFLGMGREEDCSGDEPPKNVQRSRFVLEEFWEPGELSGAPEA